MVFPGTLSRGCSRCRKRKIKVCTVSVTILPTEYRTRTRTLTNLPPMATILMFSFAFVSATGDVQDVKDASFTRHRALVMIAH